MKRYITDSWNIKIREITIERETEHSYFIDKNNRRLRTIDYHQTWEAAQQYLMQRTDKEIQNLTWQLTKLQESLTEISRLTK